MKSIIPDKVSIVTIVFFAFCVALFFCVLQNVVFGRVGRYVFAPQHPVYIDTATGAVYNVRGGFIGRPDRWGAFLALWGLGKMSIEKRAMLNNTDPIAQALAEIRSSKAVPGSQGVVDSSRVEVELPDKNIAISFPATSSEEEMRIFIENHFYSGDKK